MIPQLKCSDHPDEDVIMVNLVKDVNRQHRTLCSICKEQIEYGQLCSIENISLKTQEYAKIQLDWLAEQYNPLIETILKIRLEVASLRDKSDKMFKDVIQAIDDLSLQFNMVLNGEQSFYNDAIQDITISKLEDLGDILSGYKIREARKNQPYLKFFELGNTFSLHFKSLIKEFKLTADEIQNIFKNQYQQIQVLKVSQEMRQPFTYQLTDDKVKQEEMCYAVAFNKEGSIMVADCNGKIKVWRLENGQLKEQLIVLEGHTQYVYYLVFSKKTNWFASGSRDQTIRCWKDMGNNQWKSSEPQKMHTNYVVCILINKNEDQLISCSFDKSIKIWRVDQQNDEITYEYSLDKHTQAVFCISINESGTTLVSCGDDKHILICGIGKDRKWEYNFINDNMIASQQQRSGVTHIFEFEDNKFISKPELKIDLKQVGSDDFSLFPLVFNKSKKVLIQKHNRYVFIIRVSNDWKQFKIQQEPIDCNHEWNYGGLTADGQQLVIWNWSTEQFRVYRLNYE